MKSILKDRKPEIAFFVFALGYPLGQIKIGPVTLGSLVETLTTRHYDD